MSGGIPRPTDMSSLIRRLDEMERAITRLDGARRLSAASISSGGLTIADGGSLTITEGDLILGEGMIQGSALANQVSAVQARGTNAGSFSVGTSWGTKAQADVSVPSWATTALCMVTATVTAKLSTSMEGVDSRMQVRAAVTGSSTTGGGEVGTFPYEVGYMDFESSTSASWSDTVNVASVSTITVRAQARAMRSGWYPSNSANSAAVNALVIFLR